MKITGRRMMVLFFPMILAACGSAPREPAALLLDSAAAAAGPFVNAHAILIVRHGDIDPAQKKQMGDRAPLTEAGQERAKALAFALRDAGITRIITPTALRTEQTASPLASALHITLENPLAAGGQDGGAMPAANSGGAGDEARAVFDDLARTAKAGDTILIVEHHSVVTPLMVDFGFTHESPINDTSEFDRLYLLLPDAQHHTYQLFRLRYGGDWGEAAAGQ